MNKICPVCGATEYTENFTFTTINEMRCVACVKEAIRFGEGNNEARLHLFNACTFDKAHISNWKMIQRVLSFFTFENDLPEPKKIRIYDNFGTKQETNDRYTIVFTGNYRSKTGGEFWYMGGDSFGGYYHGSNSEQIDRPAYSHIGKKISWLDLPKPLQSAVHATYCGLWDFEIEGQPIQFKERLYIQGILTN